MAAFFIWLNNGKIVAEKGESRKFNVFTGAT
jgi:hypothetical protein